MADETQSLRLCLKELFALPAVATGWSRSEPQEIAESLANLLCRALPVAFAYVRLHGEAGTGWVGAACKPHGPIATDRVHELGDRLEPVLNSGNPEQQTPVIADPFGSGTGRLAITPLGGDGV